MAAVLGGTQSLHTNSMDEALSLPTEDAAKLALRTQQILAEESNVPNVADPCGGAYAIEALTSEIVSRAEEIIRQIDDSGGMLRAIETGWVQRQIQESAYAYQRLVDEGEVVVVGVNRYQQEEEAGISTLQIRPEVEGEQKERVASLKRKRHAADTSEALESLRRAAGSDDNLLPYILRAVKAQATVGEIADTMREVFGLYQQDVAI